MMQPDVADLPRHPDTLALGWIACRAPQAMGRRPITARDVRPGPWQIKAFGGRFPHSDGRGPLVPARPSTVPSDAACGGSRGRNVTRLYRGYDHYGTRAIPLVILEPRA
jgi:hypothetical protein